MQPLTLLGFPLRKTQLSLLALKRTVFLVCSKIDDDSLRQIRPSAEAAHNISPFGHVHGEGWLVACGR